MNSVAVVPASFASLAPHAGSAAVSVAFALPIVVCAALGAFLGGWLASHTFSERMLRRVFIAVIVALTGYKLVTLFDHGTQSGPTEESCAAPAFVFVDTGSSLCPMSR